jgi:L-ascorbate metabolism protein UlaG (beta-lactamase superfamily)
VAVFLQRYVAPMTSVLRHPDERTLYLAGDTVWNRHVEESLGKHAPDIIVLNCGDAQIVGLGSIIMGKQNVLQVHRATPKSTIVASHMEAVNHGMLSRKELREFLEEKGVAGRVLVPEDGETLRF